ncbi:MAG: hypothetical protein QXK24_03445 [Ignisphaera sp.]
MARYTVVVLMHILSKKIGVVLFIALSSTALSILALSAIGSIKSLYGVYDAFYPINSSSRFKIIISSDAVSPFTSIVDLKYIEEKLKGFENVYLQSVFVTIGFVGVEPVVIYEIKDVKDTCAYPDQELLKRTEVLWNGFIPVQSVFTQETLFLRICGVGEKPGIGVDHNTIARIRGVPSNYYSFVIVEVDDMDTLSKVYEALALRVDESAVEKLVRRVMLVAIRGGKIIEFREFQNPTEVYLAKFGIYRDYIVYLAYSIALTALIGLPLLGMGTVRYLRRDLEIFLSLGIARKSLLATFIVLLSISIALSSIASMIAVAHLDIKPLTSLLGYRIPLNIDSSDVIYIGSAQFTLCIAGIVNELKNYEG